MTELVTKFVIIGGTLILLGVGWLLSGGPAPARPEGPRRPPTAPPPVDRRGPRGPLRSPQRDPGWCARHAKPRRWDPNPDVPLLALEETP